MKRWQTLVVVVAAACVALGCVPRKLFWSADGKLGAVIGEEGLFICDADGKLSDPIMGQTQLAAWFPDSKRILTARAKDLSNWQEIKSALPGLEEPKAAAQQLRTELLAYQGPWDKFQFSMQDKLTGGQFVATVIYLRDTCGEGLAEKLSSKWEEFKILKMTTCELCVYEIADLKTIKPGPVLAVLADVVLDLRISPDGEAVAVTTPVASVSSPPMGELAVYSTRAARPPLRVAAPVAAFCDWSPDGKSLYYGTTKAPPTDKQNDLQFTLGSLTRSQVIDDHGAILDAPKDAQDLAGVMFWSMMKVRCLRDGRVLFSSCDVSLPTTSAQMPKQLGLFVIDPARQPTVTRMLPEGTEQLEGLNLGEFEISPDEKKVMVTQSSKGVSVLMLATGQIEHVIAEEKDAKELLSVPAWRTADELVIAKPDGELVIRALGGNERVINGQWPNILGPASQPASQPADDVKPLSEAATAAPMSAGESTTVTPAVRRAAILPLAVPSLPEMMAPACPMRRPGGAVRPAMKAVTGLCT